MDGNGRWAQQRSLPRIAGHRFGAKAVKRAIEYCVKEKIHVLSLFSLSIENFIGRPQAEITFLLSLFSSLLTKNLEELHQHNVKILVIGDRSVFSRALRQKINDAEHKTHANTGLTLVIAANYSGRWDIFQAAQKMVMTAKADNADPAHLKESDFAQHLCLANLPPPDLLIRTSGEQRISNFMLWQMAYTELCFIDDLWPDFNEQTFAECIAIYQQRERRFGFIKQPA